MKIKKLSRKAQEMVKMIIIVLLVLLGGVIMLMLFYKALNLGG
jgi:hypothetical protein